MIIVDTALRRRVHENKPVRVGVVGAGYSGKLIVYQILSAVPGLDVVAVANRTVEKAADAWRRAGVADPVEVSDASAADDRSASGQDVVLYLQPEAR